MAPEASVTRSNSTMALSHAKPATTVPLVAAAPTAAAATTAPVPRLARQRKSSIPMSAIVGKQSRLQPKGKPSSNTFPTVLAAAGPVPAAQAHNQTTSTTTTDRPASVQSQIPRSGIPRPPTMTNLTAAAAASAAPGGTGSTTAPSTLSAATSAAISGLPGAGASRGALRSINSVKTLARPASVSGLPMSSAMPRSTSHASLVLDKAVTTKAAADKPLVGTKRIPLPPLSPEDKDDPPSPSPNSKHASALHGVARPRLMSMIEGHTLGSKPMPLVASGMRVPLPRTKLSPILPACESPTPQPGSVAAKIHSERQRGSASTPDPISSPPSSSPAAKSSSSPTVTKRTTATSTAKAPPAPTISVPSGAATVATRKLRRAMPETPALRTLLARDRERERDETGDASGISHLTLADADISLASSTSFSQLTPPTGRRASMLSRVVSAVKSPGPLTAATGGGGATAPTASSALCATRSSAAAARTRTHSQSIDPPHAHASNRDLRLEIARVHDERRVLEARVAALAAEEVRLKAAVDAAMRDREHAVVVADEAEAQRDAVRWDGVVEAIDEAMEEATSMRSTIEAMRGIVEQW